MERLIQRDGAMPADAVGIVSQTLESVMQYFVETEPMQLARLVIEAVKSNSAIKNNKPNRNSRNVLLQGQSSVFIPQDSTASSFLRNKTDYSLEKYHGLRVNSQPTGFLGRKSNAGPPTRNSTFGRKSVTNLPSPSNESTESTRYSTEALIHPLLRLNKSVEKDALDAFKALQVVMTDRPLQTCLNIRSSLFSDLKPDDADFSVLATRIVEVGINAPLLRDELYVQMCKQLNSNPSIKSLTAGWTLLAVYLHCFGPSSDFFPYLKNFMFQQSVQPISALSASTNTSSAQSAASAKRSTIKNRLTMTARLSMLTSSRASASPQADINANTTDEEKKKLKKLIDYANKILPWTEEEMQMGIHGFKSEISFVDVQLMNSVMHSTRLNLKIGMLTGSVYEISFCFGEIANVFSILTILFDQIIGKCYAEVDTMKTMPNVKEEKSKDTISSEAPPTHGGKRGPAPRVSVLERSSSTFYGDRSSAYGFKHPDIIAKCFRGFCFYDDHDLTENLDAKTIPVQPSHSHSIPWNRDIIWDMLQRSGSDDTRMLYLRRKHLLVSEKLIDSQLDLFGDEVSHNDPLGLRKLWIKWLSDPLPDLPVDHMRVDLLFAEESRYVNSQLYGISDDGCAYLLALQLLLSWNVEEQIMMVGNQLTDLKWGSGHSYVMRNIDTSVRPSAYSAQPSQKAACGHPGTGGTNGEQGRSIARTNAIKKNSEIEDVENDSEGSSDNEDDLTVNDQQWHGSAIDINSLSDADIDYLKSKLIFLGISEASITPDFYESIAYFMSQIQSFAMQINVATQNQRFRYMMKVAYLNYVMSWPLAGGSFAMTSCDVTGQFVKTLLCISANGMFLLTVDEWCLVFHSPLYDIESYKVSSVPDNFKASSEDKMLTLVINEVHIQVISTSIDDVKNALDELCLELLGKGVYPHGLEGGFDILDKNEEFVSSTDPQALIQRFNGLFSFLPVPPTPLPLMKAHSYVEPPKSRRAILAEARAEEERIEIEQARLAAQAAADRNQAHIEKGRQTLTTMMEDDDDDDDEDEGTKKAPGRVKRQRRRISLLGKGRQHVNPIQLRMQMVENAVCGVSTRPVVVENIVVPPTPKRRTGMRTDSMLESGLDLSETPPPLSSMKCLETDAPFSGKLILEPMLLPKEASLLKSLKFPLIPEWGNNMNLHETSSDVDCGWMFEETNDIDSEWNSYQISEMHSERHSDFSRDEEKDDASDIDSTASFYSQDISQRPKSGSKLQPITEDDDDASFFSHEIDQRKNSDVDSNDSFFSHEIKKKLPLEDDNNSEASFYSHEIDAGKRNKSHMQAIVEVDEESNSFISSDVKRKQSQGGNTSIASAHDSDASFYSHEISQPLSKGDDNSEASFYSHDISQKQTQGGDNNSDASFYSHEINDKKHPKTSDNNSEASFYSQEINDNLQSRFKAKKHLNQIDEDASFYSDDL